MADDFDSFDEALEELKLKEEELKRLVSEGEIRAFRKGDTMKLRRADVETLRAALDGDLVDLGDNADELVFEDETDLGGDTGMATQEKTSRPSSTTASKRSPSSARRHRGAQPAPLLDPLRLRPDQAPERGGGGHRRGRGGARLGQRRRHRAALVLFLAMPIVVSLLTGNASGLAKGIAGIFGQTFEEAAAPDWRVISRSPSRGTPFRRRGAPTVVFEAGGLSKGAPGDGRPTSTIASRRAPSSLSGQGRTGTRSTRARRPDAGRGALQLSSGVRRDNIGRRRADLHR